MKFVLKTRDNNYSIPLTKSNLLWELKEFNRNLSTVILVTGWTTNGNKSNGGLDTIYSAYMCRGNVNFIVRYSTDKNCFFFLK